MNTRSGRVFNVAAMAALLSFFLLVMPGTAMALNHLFVDNGDGTVTVINGQMWTKKADLFDRETWHTASNACKSLSISGISGWRLPTDIELNYLCNYLRRGHPFDGFFYSEYYWTGLLDLRMEEQKATARVVNMRECTTGNLSIDIHVRLGVWCVRDRN